ncbi:MAG: cell wall hydrolase [Pseudomonadota bacterium]
MALLLAIIAVPAVAAPGDFGAIAGDAPFDATAEEVSDAARDALPFEKPGMSFPGSAFYYLADPPAEALVALPKSNPNQRGAEGGREIGALIDAGPAASPFTGAGLGLAKAQDCLAQAVWYEAASESEAGQRAVAQVVLNRVAHPSWPASVCGVVYEGSSRSTGCQFSFTCDGSLNRKTGGDGWRRAQKIAREALGGKVYAPIGHATHYHTLWVDPYWADSLAHVGTIGAHRFYRQRGRAGEKSAFNESYAGAEPGIAEAVQTSTPSGKTPVETLISVQPALPVAVDDLAPAEVGSPLLDQTDPVTAENLANPALGSAGQARQEFAKAGQWKVDPATLNLSSEDGPSDPPED